VSNAFALKALCPEQYDEKVRRDKNKQSGQNAQDVLNGLLSIMIDEQRRQKQEIYNAIAEQRATTEANIENLQRQRMPQLGTRNEATGRPVVTVEPIDAVDAEIDEPDNRAKRQQLPDTTTAEALKKTIAQMAPRAPADVAPNE
jgi:hypothetical protein